jgi:hypothetical protein
MMDIRTCGPRAIGASIAVGVTENLVSLTIEGTFDRPERFKLRLTKFWGSDCTRAARSIARSPRQIPTRRRSKGEDQDGFRLFQRVLGPERAQGESLLQSERRSSGNLFNA